MLARLIEETVPEAADRAEIEVRVAPLEHPQRVEGMVFEGFDGRRVEGRASSGGPEGAVAHVAPGPARDLAELGRIELAETEAVELLVGCERDVIDIEVQSHADGVGRDEIIDVTGLVELDLRVAGSRRERPEHHGGAAPLTPDELRDGVDLLRVPAR